VGGSIPTTNVICGTPDLKLPEQTALELPQRAWNGEQVPYAYDRIAGANIPGGTE